MTSTLIRCLRCQTPYEWRKSSSLSLKMTYCGSMCEIAANGHTIEDLIAVQRKEVAV